MTALRQLEMPVGLASQPIVLPSLVGLDFKPLWVKGETDIEYHANLNAVGSTSIKYAAANSQAKFYEYYVNGEDKDTKAKLLGRLAHKAVLEPNFWKLYVVEPHFGDQRKPENKAKKKDWHEQHAGCNFITAEQERQIKGMAESLFKHPDAMELLSHGINEMSGYYRDPRTGILCKIRPDIRADHIGVIADLKTCMDASEEGFAKACGNYGYHASLAMYGDGTEEITGNKIDMWVLIAVETSAPYEVCVYYWDKEEDRDVIESGRRIIRTGLSKIHQGLTTGVWATRQQKSSRLPMPQWVLK